MGNHINPVGALGLKGLGSNPDDQGAISLFKLLGSKLGPKLGYFVLPKERLNFSETAP